MIEFSILWAAVGGIATGALVGIWRGPQITRLFDPRGVLVGMFFGAVFALPLALSHLLSAIAVTLLLASAGFALRFLAFALGSLGLYFAMLRAWHRGLEQVGGLINGRKDAIWYLLFFAGSLVICLGFMAAAPRI